MNEVVPDSGIPLESAVGTVTEISSDSISVRKVVRELIETVVVSLLVFLAIHSSIENFRVDGSSMSPTLVDGQHIIANKIIYTRIKPESFPGLLPFIQAPPDQRKGFTFYPPNRGDVMIIVYPKDTSRDIVKRIIGVPGDVIEIREGRVHRNGEILNEPYVAHQDARSFSSVRVPANSYYVLGDNRLVSNDSRHWGFVSDEHIIGHAWLSYWPSERLEFLQPFW